jgi:hypothetical protein
MGIRARQDPEPPAREPSDRTCTTGCNEPISAARLQLLQDHPGAWYPCETTGCEQQHRWFGGTVHQRVTLTR